MIGIFPASILGEEIPKRVRKVRPHTVHKLRVISSCLRCDTPLLMGCVWTNRRGVGFCVYTEKIEKRHRCV